MKTLSLFITIVLVSICLSAENSYNETMANNIAKMYKVYTVDDLIPVANTFERIANVETTQWLPAYYAAYSYIRMTFFVEDGDKKDEYLDKAQVFIDKAIKVNDSESEIYVLQAFLHNMRIYTPLRGYTYSQYSNKALEKAEKLNPENPRIYYLMGENIYHTPSMFGGGKESALPLLEKAKAKFAAFKNDDPLWPNWGADRSEEILKLCKEE